MFLHLTINDMPLINIHKDVFSITDTGLVRKTNEDSCGIAETSNGILCVVCDGMGGHNGGAQASRIAVDCIIQYLSKEKYINARVALKESFDFANLQILGAASEHPELNGMGTTACALLIQDDCVWLAHAGDSRIYLYVAKEKHLYRLTKDHSYIQGLIDQGLITEEEAEKQSNKNIIIKALGIKEDINAEVCNQPIFPAKGDIFLICSDGLSGMISDIQIKEILSDKTEMFQKEASLMLLAKSAGGTDNITFQMIRISNNSHKKEQTLQRIKYVRLTAVIIISIWIGIWIGGRLNKPLLDTTKIPIDSINTIKTPINDSIPKQKEFVKKRNQSQKESFDGNFETDTIKQ
jgi:protein phosphatase